MANSTSELLRAIPGEPFLKRALAKMFPNDDKTSGIGYTTGAGAAVTQTGSRSTGVTINAVCGTITGDATSLAAGAKASFLVSNSSVGLRDVVVISVSSGPTVDTSIFNVSTTIAGFFIIKASNISAATADTGAPIINFAVIRGANS